MRAAALLFSCPALAIVACSGGGSPGGGGDGGTGGMAGTSGGGGAGCASIENIGQLVTQVQAIGTVPEPRGGVIAAGVYVLTKNEAYPPETANVPLHSRETLSISGTSWVIASVSDDQPDGFSALATLTAADPDLTLEYLCGPGVGLTFEMGYTATTTELILISPPGGVATYTRQ